MNAEDVLASALSFKRKMDEDFIEWFEPSMPINWTDSSGLRHAVIYGGDLIPEKLTLERIAIGDHYTEWVIKEEIF